LLGQTMIFHIQPFKCQKFKGFYIIFDLIPSILKCCTGVLNSGMISKCRNASYEMHKNNCVLDSETGEIQKV